MLISRVAIDQPLKSKQMYNLSGGHGKLPKLSVKDLARQSAKEATAGLGMAAAAAAAVAADAPGQALGNAVFGKTADWNKEEKKRRGGSWREGKLWQGLRRICGCIKRFLPLRLYRFVKRLLKWARTMLLSFTRYSIDFFFKAESEVMTAEKRQKEALRIARRGSRAGSMSFDGLRSMSIIPGRSGPVTGSPGAEG